MDVGSPEWIETSLARLDELEAAQVRLESELETIEDPTALAAKSRELETVETELKSLYAQLESVADDEGDEDEGEAAAEDAPRVTQGDDELSAPHGIAAAAAAAGVGSAPAAAPAATPAPAPEPAPVPIAPAPEPAPAPIAAAADSPFGSSTDDPFGSAPPATGAGGGFDAAPTSFDDSDLKPKGGGSKWVFVIVVLLAAAAGGGWFAVQNMQKGKADTKTDGAKEVIKIEAADVPDDTEAPNAAKGGGAVVSPNAAGDDAAAKKKKKKKGDDDKKTIKLDSSDAPLGGI